MKNTSFRPVRESLFGHFKMAPLRRSLTPPVDIEIFTENTNQCPFFRIEIPSGNQKPYCTLGGTYKIRGDGRTNALLPGRLLTMFMEKESQQFIERYQEATKNLENSLEDIKAKISAELQDLLRNTQEMEKKINGTLENIFTTAVDAAEASQEAHSLSEETFAGIDSTIAAIDGLDQRIDPIEWSLSSIKDIETKLNAVLRNLEIDDPLIEITKIRAKEYITLALYEDEANKEELIEKLMKNHRGGAAKREHLEKWYDEAVCKVKERKARTHRGKKQGD